MMAYDAVLRDTAVRMLKRVLFSRTGRRALRGARRYLLWLVANGQTFVEWCLLEGSGWATSFSTAPVRQRRLQRLVARAQVTAGVPGPPGS